MKETNSSTYAVNRCSERSIAVLVNRSGLDQRDVDGNQAATEKQRNLVKEDRNRVSSAIGDRLAHVSSHEGRFRAEDVSVVGLGIVRWSFRVHYEKKTVRLLVMKLASLSYCE